MSNVIISKTILTAAKRKLLISQSNPSGWTKAELKQKVREAIEEEMDKKESELDTDDKMIVYLLSVGSVGNHSINDMLSIKIGD